MSPAFVFGFILAIPLGLWLGMKLSNTLPFPVKILIGIGILVAYKMGVGIIVAKILKSIL